MKNIFKSFDSIKVSKEMKDKLFDNINNGKRINKFAGFKVPAAAAAGFVLLLICFTVFTVTMQKSNPAITGGYKPETAAYGNTQNSSPTAAPGSYPPVKGNSGTQPYSGDSNPVYTSEETETAKNNLSVDNSLVSPTVNIDPAGPEISAEPQESKSVDDMINAPGAPTNKPSSTPSATQAFAPKENTGVLTAKEINDNGNFDFWKNLVKTDVDFSAYAKSWGISVTDRIAVYVKNGNINLCGVKAVLKDVQGNAIWSAVSDNKGMAYVFYNVTAGKGLPASLTVSTGNYSKSVTITNPISGYMTVDLAGAGNITPALDLMFVCDTTGSMRDELSYIQSDLNNVISRVKNDNANITVRLSVNFYRDKGDEYILRSFPFTTDITSSINNLNAQKAGGGGDYPEAVDQALDDAINNHQWSDTATAKLLFLILDSPPHDYAAANMQKLIYQAAQKGIRIIPVTGSSTDKNTEYITRALDIATGGTYVTLTDDSGISSGGHIDPSAGGPIDVNKLNDLLVNIINRYLKY